ncbi:tyrosine-type recombinase/integrase [Candidatus Woesearchaeota archaeon]|nr:tyrosine-type recombinase/integrase [Candidatus Woesearchaeota archaeon]
MTGFNWVLDQKKFLSSEEVTTLLETAEQRAKEAIVKGHKVAVRDYFIVHLALSTGLRVMEITQLKCGDIFLGAPASSLIVRKGKNGKKRLVWFNGSLRHHYEDYIRWKQSIEEPIGSDDPLLLSSNTSGHMTTRAIEKAFKRTAARANLPSHYSIHCLRHTYASHLYKASGYNLRLVQKQLGHSSCRTTEVYADVLNTDLSNSLEKLYA